MPHLQRPGSTRAVRIVSPPVFVSVLISRRILASSGALASPSGSFAGLLSLVFLVCVASQLLDVVHQAIQPPLRAHFLLATQCEAVQSLGVPDVGEHRFDGGNPLAVDRPSSN